MKKNHSDNPSGMQSTPATKLSYVSGYLLSLTLTLIAFELVRSHINSHHLVPSDDFTLFFLAVLAFVQLGVQLTFFLHLDREPRPRWKLQVFGFMVIILLIIVVGSLWIMAHLNYRMADSPKQVNQYLNSQDGL